MGCQQILRERPGRGKGGVKIVRSNFHRERFYCLFLCVRVFRVVHGSWNLKGLSLVDLKRFEEESKESFPLPSRVGTRAVKEEEALVRAVRVVRGSCF